MSIDMVSTKELQYFTGKVCTILTKQVTGSFRLEDRRFVDFFTGRVVAVNQATIWLEHIITKTKSAFFVDSIAAIVEEQTIPADHPDVEDLKKEYKDRQQAVQAKTILPKPPVSPYVSVDSLKRTADELKERYKAEDDLR